MKWMKSLDLPGAATENNKKTKKMSLQCLTPYFKVDSKR